MTESKFKTQVILLTLNNEEKYVFAPLISKRMSYLIIINDSIEISITNDTDKNFECAIVNENNLFNLENIRIDGTKIYDNDGFIMTLKNVKNLFLSDNNKPFKDYQLYEKNIGISESFVGFYEKYQVYVRTKDLRALLSLND